MSDFLTRTMVYTLRLTTLLTLTSHQSSFLRQIQQNLLYWIVLVIKIMDIDIWGDRLFNFDILSSFDIALLQKWFSVVSSEKRNKVMQFSEKQPRVEKTSAVDDIER